MDLHERTEKHLRTIEKRGLRRVLQSPDAASVDLSSNDYLSLANDERIKRAAIIEIERNGVGATASRLLRGEREVFRRVESDFADFKNTEKSLFFGSGYAANIGVLTAFLEADDVVFSDELNHASIIDGLRLAKAEKKIFPHNDFVKLTELVEQTPCRGERFLVVESLFSMDGDFAPLAQYAEICRAHKINLIVDEAHAVGVFGATGNGLISQNRIESDVFLSINTAGKALGVGGAFVAGNDWAIDFLIQRSRPFIFSTAPLPATAAALIESIKIVQTESARRQNLLQISAFLRRELNRREIKVESENSQIISIVLGASERAVEVAQTLQAQGFDVRAIRPPTVPVNTARLRISLNSDLSEDVLGDFVNTAAHILL